jgi:phage terminase large subunit
MVTVKQKPPLTSKKNRRQRFRQDPFLASRFNLLDDNEKKALITCGAVPVNDIFFDLWNNQSKILLLYGGFGSGKSVFIVDVLINKCLNDDYFRCFFGRKTFEAVRSSVFATITDRIEERGLQDQFIYSKADNSSMIIKCRANGNYFHPFGSDNADKLKSVKDPSHIFCEELDQFSLPDFGVLISRLRTEKTKTQFIGAFNTTKVKEGHWLKTTFFGETLTKFSEYTITKRFCNYTDNYFINQKEYEQTLWISAGFNEQKYHEYANGEWGADEKDNLFIYAFRSKAISNRKPGYCHVVKGLEVDYSLPVYISFDFNVDPCTALICQHAPDRGWISIIDEIRLTNSDIYEVCERIKVNWPNAFIYVTGDASGRNRSAMTKGGKNFFKIIKAELGLGSTRFKIPGQNPSIKNSRILTNSILAKHPATLIDERCKYLIEDLQNVTTDENGDIDKTKDAHRSHLLDCLRYYFNTFFYDFIEWIKKHEA